MFATRYHAKIKLPGKGFELEGEITPAACTRLSRYVTREPSKQKAIALEIYVTLCDGQRYERSHVEATSSHQEYAQ